MLYIISYITPTNNNSELATAAPKQLGTTACYKYYLKALRVWIIIIIRILYFLLKHNIAQRVSLTCAKGLFLNLVIATVRVNTVDRDVVNHVSENNNIPGSLGPPLNLVMKMSISGFITG